MSRVVQPKGRVTFAYVRLNDITAVLDLEYFF